MIALYMLKYTLILKVLKLEQQNNIVELPQEFEEYVNKKLENGRGRKHLIKDLGTLEKTIQFLTDSWINNHTPRELSKKYSVGYYQVYRFLNEVEQYKEQVIEYID